MILVREPRLLLCGPYYTVTIVLYDYIPITDYNDSKKNVCSIRISNINKSYPSV